jgi:hypothetical protein
VPLAVNFLTLKLSADKKILQLKTIAIENVVFLRKFIIFIYRKEKWRSKETTVPCRPLLAIAFIGFGFVL